MTPPMTFASALRSTLFPKIRRESKTPPIEDFYCHIFELELEAWCTDQAQWPEKRDLVTFREWFEVTAESVVADLADGAIEIEEV